MRLVISLATVLPPLVWTSCAKTEYADYSEVGRFAPGGTRLGRLVIDADPQSGHGQAWSTELPPAFSVFDEAGTKVVDRAQGTAELPPGRYLVKLVGHDVQPEGFWVSLESGRTTVVDVGRLGKEGKGAVEVR